MATLADELAEELEHLDDQFGDLVELFDYLVGTTCDSPHSARLSRFLANNLATARARVVELRAQLWRIGFNG